MTEGEFFRANVGAIITRADGAVLTLRRADVDEESWQLPQGGIRSGEQLEDAVRREIEEEVGLAPNDYTIVGRAAEWLTYELPPEYRSPKIGRGQVQMWFHCRFAGPESRIVVDGVEFDAMTWLQPRQLADQAVSFRRSIYRRLIDEFGLE